jgi:hypothetical protein
VDRLQDQRVYADDFAMDSDAMMASISIASPRHWFGNQSLGAFSIYLDGASIGAVEPQGVLRIPCIPGHHVLHARQWWYFSPRLHIDVNDGEKASVVVDLVRRDSTVARFLALMFTPWRGVILTTIADGSIADG